MKAMKRIGLIFGLLVMVAVGTRAQSVTVSGNLKDLGVNNITQQSSYVVFYLQNFGSNIPTVNGTNVIVAQASAPFRPNASGVISGSIQSNDSISPTSTFYRVCVYAQSVLFECNNYLINFATSSTFNLNSATPVNAVYPPPTLIGSTGTITGTSLSASCDSGTAAVSGAVPGAPVIIGTTDGTDVGGAFYLRGSVTSAGVVTVYVCGTGTPPSKAYNVRVLR